MIIIYHNSRCSKSRECLSLVENFAARKQLQVEVVEYLKTPLRLEQLAALQEMLGCKTAAMVRSNEEDYAALGLEQASDAELLKAVAAHPNLMQRPIVIFGNRAVIGRPTEAVTALLTD